MNKGTLSGNMIHTLLVPVSINGGKSGDVINLENYNHASIVIAVGAVASGTSKLTLEYCDDNTPTTDTAMAFNYRKMTDGAGATDTWGDLTAATSSGITIDTANTTYLIEIDAAEVMSASSGSCSRLQVELSDPSGADYMCVIAILTEPRYAKGTPVTCID